MRREKPPGRQKGARLFSMLLAVCLMIAALPLSVSAAGEYVPGNPRWSGYQNQVQWDRPAGAASGDSFEYEAQLLLGDDVVESKAVEIDTYLFFTNDVVTRPQEEYTITRQPEERIHPNRTAEIPKTDSICKGENEDASKKEFAGAAAVLMHGGRNTAGDSVCCGAICAGKSPLVGIRKPGNVE